jgi:hypothetical protein
MHYRVNVENDAEYVIAVAIDEAVINPLYRIGIELDEVQYDLDDGVDNEAQRDYIREQINELIYKLTEMRNNMEE